MNSYEILTKHISWIKRYVDDENIKNADVYEFIGDTFEKVLEDCKVLDEKNIKEFIESI